MWADGEAWVTAVFRPILRTCGLLVVTVAALVVVFGAIKGAWVAVQWVNRALPW